MRCAMSSESAALAMGEGASLAPDHSSMVGQAGTSRDTWNATGFPATYAFSALNMTAMEGLEILSPLHVKCSGGVPLSFNIRSTLMPKPRKKLSKTLSSNDI